MHDARRRNNIMNFVKKILKILTVVMVVSLFLFPIFTSNFSNENLKLSSNSQKVCDVFKNYFFATSKAEGIFAYSVNGNNATITNCNKSTSGKLEIPSTIDGYQVVAIGNGAFKRCTALTTITIPSTVKTIGNNIFEDCSSLKEVNLPEGLTTIPDYAFRNCVSLVSADIPDTVTSIGDYVFYQCTSLSSVDLGSSVKTMGYYVFYGCSELKNIEIPKSLTSCDYSNSNYRYSAFSGSSIETATFESGTMVVPNYIFSQCALLKNVVLPEGITSIGSYSFKNCSALTTITIPSTVKTIGNNIFEDCSSLKEVNLPEGLTTIPDYAFRNCVSLVSADIPDTVTSIGNYAFYQCSKIPQIKVPHQVTRIYNYAFDACSSAQSVYIGEKVTTISTSSFSECHNVKSIEYNAINCSFMGTNYESFFPNLQNVKIGSKVKTIPANVFYNCHNITEIVLPETLEMICKNAFYGCSSLTNIIIPKNVRTIDDFAFYGCSSIIKMILPQSVTTVGKEILGNCYELQEVFFPDTIRSIGTVTFKNCSKLKSVVLPDCVNQLSPECFYKCSSLENVKISMEITKIDEQTFYGCISLKNITLPENLTYIGEKAFYNCGSLEEVNISQGVTFIGEKAFMGCKKLEEIILPENVLEIGDGAFSDCNELSSVTFNPLKCSKMGSLKYPVFVDCNQLSTVNIGSDVQEIPEYAFYGCEKLLSISIPNNTTNLGIGAFWGCNSLVSISIGKSVDNADAFMFKDYSELTEIKVEGDNNKFASVNDILFLKDMSEIISYPAGKDSQEFVVPDSVNKINEYAFANNSLIKRVILNENLESIEFAAFMNCNNLSSLVVPVDVKEIKDMVFNGCDNMTISCFKNSNVYNYAVENGIKINPIGFIEEDFESGVIIVAPIDSLELDTESSIRSVESGNDFNYAEKLLKNKGEEFVLYDLSLSNNPLKNIEVRIPVPFGFADGSSGAYLISDNGELLSLSMSTNNGYYIVSVPSDGMIAVVNNKRDWVKVTSVKISRNAINIKTGDSYDLMAQVEPNNASNKEVVWFADNQSVVTVSQNGRITGVSEGIAYVTATSADGGFASSCKVTVMNPDNYQSDDVQICDFRGNSINNTYLHKIGWFRMYKNISIRLRFKTNVSYSRAEWTSDNSKIKVDQRGNITNTGSGARSATITLTLYDSFGNVISRDSVKVVIYKFNNEVKKLNA